MGIEKDLKKLLNGADAYIVSTTKGIAINGTGAEILSLLASLIKYSRSHVKGMTDERLRECIELAFKSDEELKDELLKKLKEIQKILKNKGE